MQILLVSAGTKINGATQRALSEAKEVLETGGAKCDVFNLYSTSLYSCSGCGACKINGRCIYNDEATALADIVKNYDGFMFFTPVHYGGASGSLKSALGRVFYSQKSSLEFKPAATVAVSRRGGNFTAVEEINRFFGFASMPIISGNYPGIIHGTTKEEVEKDSEGLQIVRSIATNMLWILRCIKNGEPSPRSEEKILTNYIR